MQNKPNDDSAFHSFFRRWRMELPQISLWMNIVVLVSFVLLFATKMMHWLPKDINDNSLALWVYTDWLIDYSSGFTRRGLSGELLKMASGVIHPYDLTVYLQWFVLSAVAVGYARLCIKSLNLLGTASLAALLFLPSLLPFYLYDHNAFGRKEVIGFLIVLWHLWAIESHKGELQNFRRYIYKFLAVALVLLPIHVLVHESSALLFVPVHVIITYSVLAAGQSIRPGQRLFYLILLYLPVILAFAIVLIFGRPSFDAALAMCGNWELANALPPGLCLQTGQDRMWALPGALTALPWTLSQAISQTASFSAMTILAWLVNFAVLGFATAYFCQKAARSLLEQSVDAFMARHLPKIMGYKYFLLPLLISLPLYLLGVDWGRWFAVCCINYAMISLSKEIGFIEHATVKNNRTNLPSSGTLERESQNNPRFIKSSIPSIYWELTLLCLIAVFMRMPHCCNNWTNMMSDALASIFTV